MVIGTTTRRVNYPESDGKPTGETEHHKLAMIRIMDILDRHFAGQQVHVTGDLLLFYEEGNPKKFVVPDVMVVKAAQKFRRRNFKVWAERRVPNVVIEVTSKKTRKRDQVEKPALYRDLGVREYFLFDPLGEYLDEPLMGYRLINGQYERIDYEVPGGLLSEELGLRLRVEEDLEFYPLDAEVRLLDSKEYAELQERNALQAKALADQKQARADEEQARADEAQTRADEAQARADEAQARADEEQARAEQERRMAEEERTRATRLAEELEEKTRLLANLQLELERLKNKAIEPDRE